MENNLEIDVKNAQALGLSYGNYKALHYDPTTTPIKGANGDRICPVCGGIVQPPKIKVCSDECARIRRNQYARQHYAEYYYSKVKK